MSAPMNNSLTADELERLQIEQFKHREQIQKANSIGRFGTNSNLALLDRQHQNYLNSLTPNERAKEMKKYNHNRVANEEEIALAAKSSKKYDKYVHQKLHEAK